MVYTLVLETSAERLRSSSLLSRTKFVEMRIVKLEQ